MLCKKIFMNILNLYYFYIIRLIVLLKISLQKKYIKSENNSLVSITGLCVLQCLTFHICPQY